MQWFAGQPGNTSSESFRILCAGHGLGKCRRDTGWCPLVTAALPVAGSAVTEHSMRRMSVAHGDPDHGQVGPQRELMKAVPSPGHGPAKLKLGGAVIASGPGPGGQRHMIRILCSADDACLCDGLFPVVAELGGQLLSQFNCGSFKPCCVYLWLESRAR